MNGSERCEILQVNKQVSRFYVFVILSCLLNLLECSKMPGKVLTRFHNNICNETCLY